MEVAFDQGVIEAADHRVSISEIELELKSGAPAVLYELALQLLDHHAFKLGVQSKSDRGYALAPNAAPVSAKAPPTNLDPETAIGEAFAQIFCAAHVHVLVNQAAAEDGRDPEGVHQMRVGLRRLRSALSLLRPIAPSSTSRPCEPTPSGPLPLSGTPKVGTCSWPRRCQRLRRLRRRWLGPS